MPQGRRRKPFSHKAKMQQKKKEQTNKLGSLSNRNVDRDEREEEGSSRSVLNVNDCKTSKVSSKPNRYALQFYRETNAEINERKELACQSLNKAKKEDLEIDYDSCFVPELDFPKRPSWNFMESLEKLNMKENQYFTKYISNIEKNFNWKELGYFELNLETWRQLWRVLEMSDIVLFIVDIRFAGLMFPPSLYDYVAETLKRDMILVINKIDLAPTELVVAWKTYFQEKYPKLHILLFTTLPSYNLVGNQGSEGGLQSRRRRTKFQIAAEGTQLLIDVCKDIVGGEVDLSSWQEKVKVEMQDSSHDDKVDVEELINVVKADTEFFEHEKYKNGVLTIGCIGHPNVGKSSVINAIMGKKVVSVSKTPGHTKHFQTIFVTKNVKLCDCPGLVFPSKVPKVLQVLMGCYPIAQLREPFTTVKFLAENLNLQKMMRLQHPENEDEWSAMDICEAWARKRGFVTAKAARLDTYRAANNLLRFALDGKICLCLKPPKFFENREFWCSHPENETVKWIMGNIVKQDAGDFHDETSDEEEEEAAVSESHATNGSNSESNNEDTESSDNDEPVSSNKFAALSAD
ncbi:hypothetical protein RI129_008515 [Pyrocoelia pectoralis]|uniref:Guanine nucleotide-binding protein-like 1 n=1 Tax=Pyrocoelia pectoralis TaxID=417401 RepID=A0AAN7VBD9_9COLE